MLARLGRYDVIALLGVGDSGAVYEARDPELRRTVAVKLLSSKAGLDARGAARMRREGVAMARLSHPNVIRVYDVGIEGGQVFVAMELIPGVTLAQWLARAPHTAAAVIAVFVEAGRGLAAVHAAGMAHRDFSPRRVLVGDDGRVVITGAGLAVASSGAAASDQLAFCVALARALPAGGAATVRAALTRGLDRDPARRFPSMPALLAALPPPPSQRWLVLPVAAALAGVMAVSTVPDRGAEDPCPAPATQVAAVWGPARRLQLESHLRGVDPARGQGHVETAARVIDPFARAWTAHQVEMCRDTRVRRTQSDQMLDRRMVCLDRALAQLDESLGGVLRSAERDAVDDAMLALGGLAPLEACTDISATTEKRPPPRAPAPRAEFDAVSREIAAVDARRRVKRELPRLEARATATVERARRFGHEVLLADALWSLAMVQAENEATDAAMATLHEHVIVAAAARDDAMVAESWARLIAMTADAAGRPDAADALVPAAEAAVTRGGGTPLLRYLLVRARLRVALVRRDFARATDLLEDGRRLIELARADGRDVSMQVVLSRVDDAYLAVSVGNWARAVERYRAELPRIVEQLGPDHPQVITANYNLGVALLNLGDAAAAAPAFQAAARIGEARFPPSVKLAGLLQAHAYALEQLGQCEAALVSAARAIEVSEQAGPKAASSRPRVDALRLTARCQRRG